MLIIPAIDLKDGRCVRLQQGRMDTATVFSDNPVAMAKHWAAQGAKRLHIVDLNGAVAGRPKNEKVIREMIAAVGDAMAVQVGGGIRDLATIEAYLARAYDKLGIRSRAELGARLGGAPSDGVGPVPRLDPMR